ncbi:hypothetical protein [Crateriforma conspicua]|nr:hypothetical protein [Crateriforma conspicua]
MQINSNAMGNNRNAAALNGGVNGWGGDGVLAINLPGAALE